MEWLRGLFGGVIEEEQEDVDVLAEAQTRVERNPDDAGAHFDLGTVYYVRGRTEDAVEALERAVELAPDDDDTNYMLGLAYAKLGQGEEAQRYFEAAGEKSDNPMLQGYAEQKVEQIKKGVVLTYRGTEEEEQE